MNPKMPKIVKSFFELSKSLKENLHNSRNTFIKDKNQILSVIFSNFSINLGDPPPGFERFAKPAPSQKKENIKEGKANKQDDKKKEKQESESETETEEEDKKVQKPNKSSKKGKSTPNEKDKNLSKENESAGKGQFPNKWLLIGLFVFPILVFEIYFKDKKLKSLEELKQMIKNKEVISIDVLKPSILKITMAKFNTKKGSFLCQVDSVNKLEDEINKIQGELNIAQNDRIKINLQQNFLDPINQFDYNSKKESNFPFLLIIIMGLAFLLTRRRLRNIKDIPKNANSTKKQMNEMQEDIAEKLKGKMPDFGNMFTSRVKEANESKLTTKFHDVAGMEQVKEEIYEFVDFLKNPKIYKKLGAKIPRGALLCGPPGTGKTLLAKAVAGEAEVPFFSISASEFVELFAGKGASKVRELFEKAREKAPSIIFIDELDAIGKRREGRLSSGNEESEQTLNQLLVEMDGFETDSKVVVLAATNRKDMLDPALTRPGRFDRIIDIPLPSITEREEIFKVHLKKLVVDPNVTKDSIAKNLCALTPGLSGADISQICNEAAIIAARENKSFVELSNFDAAIERNFAGLKKKVTMNVNERKLVAYHECGHAFVSWNLANAMPLLKITIIPRSKGSLGYTQFLPQELNLFNYDQIYDMLCTLYGGRAAEEVFFGYVTTGARDDVNKASEIITNLISVQGMGKSIRNLSYKNNELFRKPFSDYTNRLIDEEIKTISNSCFENAKNIISNNKEIFEKLSTTLLQKESMNIEEVMEILGERKVSLNKDILAYIHSLKKK